MASFIARQAARRAFTTSTRRLAEPHPQEQMKQESKRNPELMILAGVVVCALAGAGTFISRAPTKGNTEDPVTVAQEGMPWQGKRGEGKYRYHPKGDKRADPKEAPSALNVVVVPEVTLPKHLHDRFNKWGKEDY